LKSASHASKLPVPQDAASAGAAGVINTTPTATVLRRERGVIATVSSEMVLDEITSPRRPKISAATAAKTRLAGADGSVQV
jgi:hypothetical protein